MERSSQGATRPVVWVFGAGITGLTVAHEMSERGYEVHVVERAADPTEPGEPAVGGVARTQWAFVPWSEESTGERPARAMLQTRPLFDRPVIEFLRDEDPLDPVMARAVEELARNLVATGVAREQSVEVRTVCARTAARWTATRAEAVRDLLWRAMTATGAEGLRPPTLLEPVVDRSANAPIGCVIRFHVHVWGVVPGEHGFRYFPGFYKHVFDTMRRTRIATETTRTDPGSARTVFDNLVTTEATWLAIDRAGRQHGAQGTEVVRFPRRPQRSPLSLLRDLEQFISRLGHGAADISRLTLKFFQFMTSCSARRAAELEDVTWWDYLGADAMSAIAQRDMDNGPELLGAMTAKESDARTQGNCVVQLLLDQLWGRELTDATLNGPTSNAWFTHWREYLEKRGVSFEVGVLEDFTAPPRGDARFREGVLLPVVRTPEGMKSPLNFPTAIRDHFFVVAVSGAAMMGLPSLHDAAAGGTDLARRFLAQHARAMSPAIPADDPRRAVNDLEAVAAWQRAIEDEQQRAPIDVARGLGPYRHLTGVQFFFAEDIQFGREHTLYMDSAWRLSSISQAHLWSRAPSGFHNYRGIVSVDLGALYIADQGAPPRRAWDCSPEEIGARVWSQVGGFVLQDTVGLRNEGPLGTGVAPVREGAAVDDPRYWPVCFHVDACLRFNASRTAVEKNLAPYLINRPGEFRRRPGALRAGAARHDGYDVQNGAWLFAGTYAKTFTRLTTMEAANESGRHAANAILHATRAPGDRCMIWDPEDDELSELAWYRALDQRLFAEGYPHMLEILDAERLPSWILPEEHPRG